ncbi:MAG: fibronectin type III domain-containing protein [Bacteroidetes bacterium]|nr:fibronectin type III domain-containing protein [Bacteroidota bacterium]
MKPISTSLPLIFCTLFFLQGRASDRLQLMKFSTDRIANLNAALANSHQARLNWVVTSHEDVSYYIIEHSLDKAQFDSVGTVVDGNTNLYVFEDAHLNPGANYYRVRIVFADGTFDYSNIAIVNGIGDEKKIVNAAASYQMAIDLYSESADLVQVKLHDMTGKMIESAHCQVKAGKNLIRVNIPLGLDRGQYALNVVGSDGRVKFSKNLFKQ